MKPEDKARDYLARAKDARDLAAEATLQNQKDLHIRSAEAWEARASKVESIERHRVRNEAKGDAPVTLWPEDDAP
jgi:hypothetical protein